MKKIILFISIIITLMGIFSPVFNTNAAIGYCKTKNGSALPNTFENCKPPNMWVLDIIPPKCDPPKEIIKGVCVNPPPVPAGKYQLLAPLPGIGEAGGKTIDVSSDNKSSLGNYLNPMIKLIIGLSAVMAVVMIVIGGMEYMTSELAHSKESGKSKITNAVLGLLIALGSFALLNTINSDLLKSDINIETINLEIAIDDNVPQTPDPTTKKYKNGATFGSPWNDATAGPTRTPPPPPFVTLNNNGKECSSVGEKGCTSTRGLKMDQVQKIQKGCDCPLVITGGTEWWEHGGKTGSTNHQVGGTTVDIRTNNDPNSALNKYLSGGKPLVKMQWYQSPVGLILYEGNHWHIGS